jgi:hypothetical protein
MEGIHMSGSSSIQLDQIATRSESTASAAWLVSWGRLRIAIAVLLLVAVPAKIRDIVTILAGDGMLFSLWLLNMSLWILPIGSVFSRNDSNPMQSHGHEELR